VPVGAAAAAAAGHRDAAMRFATGLHRSFLCRRANVSAVAAVEIVPDWQLIQDQG